MSRGGIRTHPRSRMLQVVLRNLDRPLDRRLSVPLANLIHDPRRQRLWRREPVSGEHHSPKRLRCKTLLENRGHPLQFQSSQKG
jgi:hypothetical protein